MEVMIDEEKLYRGRVTTKVGLKDKERLRVELTKSSDQIR